MKNLAVIPARGGSKGIPGKNIKPLLGRPLIAYSIFRALKSAEIRDVVVSSDSDEILKIAQIYGAQTIKRPEELATDTALSVDVVIHAVKEMEKKNNLVYDNVVMLQPTAPLREAGDIDKALRMLYAPEADSVISFIESPGVNPEWMKYIRDGKIIDVDSTLPENNPRQKEKIYIRSGAIYAVKRNVLLGQRTFKGKNCLPYIMPTANWINIDTPRDWEVAEMVMPKFDWSEIPRMEDLSDGGSFKKGSVENFKVSWKNSRAEIQQNYYTAGRPANQIMMSFKNQWEVYKSFIGDIKPGLTSLEPGSGRGSISLYFAANGFDAYLLDTSAEVLKFAEKIFQANNLNAHFVCDDALKMPFADNFFDVIVHCGLLEHFENYEAAIREQYRVLKPGGAIIANIVPEKWSVQNFFRPANWLLEKIYGLLVFTGLAEDLKKAPKAPLYRSKHGSDVYVKIFKELGAEIEYQGGMFPVPSLSYSTAFPFTIMPPWIEKILVWKWYLVLAVRRLIWPGRHPWLCSEKWGQHVLVVARKK